METNAVNSNLLFNKTKKEYNEIKAILDKIPQPELMNKKMLNQLQKVPQNLL